TNREPRFYVSILYNLSDWVYSENGVTQVELYYTGSSGKQRGVENHSVTGYLNRKNVSPDSDVRNGRYDERPMIYFRLGEVYLNYAVALTECRPGSTDITKYLNLLRERAGLPAIEPGLNDEEMRKRIRAERRVELAFECQRFFDTRRWKIAEETD